VLRLNVGMPLNSVDMSAPWFPLSAQDTRKLVAVQKVKGTWGNTTKPKLSAKKINSADRKNFSLWFIHQLNNTLIQRATAEEQFWNSGAMSDALAKQVKNLHKKVIQALDETLNHKSAGAPPTLKNAKALLPQVEAFKNKCSKLITADGLAQFRMAVCLHDLCDDIEHYVSQIKIVFGIVSVLGNKPVMSNRPTNLGAKNLFRQLVTSHQSKFGLNSFPKPREIQSALTAKGHTIPKRTLNFWKTQIAKKTFENFIQPQKRQ
jgi:hypothetical protein